MRGITASGKRQDICQRPDVSPSKDRVQRGAVSEFPWDQPNGHWAGWNTRTPCRCPLVLSVWGRAEDLHQPLNYARGERLLNCVHVRWFGYGFQPNSVPVHVLHKVERPDEVTEPVIVTSRMDEQVLDDLGEGFRRSLRGHGHLGVNPGHDPRSAPFAFQRRATGHRDERAGGLAALLGGSS